MTAKKVLNALIVTLCAVFAFGSVKTANASSEGVDVIAASEASNWFQNEETEGQGTWNATSDKVTVDAFGCNYAMEGANYITNAASTLGAYEFETTIKITDLNNVQNPMVGFIPWYLDADNYLILQIKFTNNSSYLTTAAEKADGYAIEQLIFSGKFDGEGKYTSQIAQQENTTYDALKTTALKNAKVAPTAAEGHKLKVKFEAREAMGLAYVCSISYNDVQIGQSYAYFYNTIARNNNVGFMAQDVKAEFSNATLTDLVATHSDPKMARDWKEKNGFTYRMLNGVDTWTFNDDESISFNTGELTVDDKTSEFEVSGSNIGDYNSNRGYTENPYKEVDGLPQNYEVSATFKLDELATGNKFNQGYGLIPWYKDDINFVYVSFRRSKEKRTGPTYNEIVLSGWIDYSSSEPGTNIYELPNDFDFTAEHKLTVQKKSNRFYVYLDDIEEPILSKQIKGTELNYYYGYEGYSSKYTASKIEAKAIYAPYDEIAVVDNAGTSWRVSAAERGSWKFENSKITLNAKDNDNTLDNRSYLLGLSDVCDTNMNVVVDAKIELGDCYYSELMLSPYIYDEYNFAQIGLAWRAGKTYARVYASTMEQDYEEPKVIRVETQIDALDLSKNIKVKAEKIGSTVALYVNDELVYGRVVEGIQEQSVDFGLYVYNMDISINELATEGYKKYEVVQVGDWTTSGMKYNEWTIDENGHLIGDGTYTKQMEKEDEDGERNFAIKKNELATSGSDYKITATVRAGKQSEAQDRLGVVMWYVDDDNFMLFFIDHWRADSTVPRTTIYGKLNGETLPVTFNHGGWFPEGSNPIESAGGLTRTELSQVFYDHTITVLKEGDRFTCYVDDVTMGYISYPVQGGLPETNGKDVYSGVYTLNDEIIVSSYDVTDVAATVNKTTPAPAGNPINSSISAPLLGSYNEKAYVDEFDPNAEAPELDVTKPTVSITTASTATAGQVVTVTYTASDDLTSAEELRVEVTVTKDGSEVTLNDYKFTAEEGSYLITVKVTDDYGNSETATLTVTVGASAPDAPKGGCGGSVVASLFGMITLIGAAVVLRKRKQD